MKLENFKQARFFFSVFMYKQNQSKVIYGFSKNLNVNLQILTIAICNKLQSCLNKVEKFCEN